MLFGGLQLIGRARPPAYLGPRPWRFLAGIGNLVLIFAIGQFVVVASWTLLEELAEGREGSSVWLAVCWAVVAASAVGRIVWTYARGRRPPSTIRRALPSDFEDAAGEAEALLRSLPRHDAYRVTARRTDGMRPDITLHRQGKHRLFLAVPNGFVDRWHAKSTSDAARRAALGFLVRREVGKFVDGHTRRARLSKALTEGFVFLLPATVAMAGLSLLTAMLTPGGVPLVLPVALVAVGIFLLQRPLLNSFLAEGERRAAIRAIFAMTAVDRRVLSDDRSLVDSVCNVDDLQTPAGNPTVAARLLHHLRIRPATSAGAAVMGPITPEAPLSLGHRFGISILFGVQIGIVLASTVLLFIGSDGLPDGVVYAVLLALTAFICFSAHVFGKTMKFHRPREATGAISEYATLLLLAIGAGSVAALTMAVAPAVTLLAHSYAVIETVDFPLALACIGIVAAIVSVLVTLGVWSAGAPGPRTEGIGLAGERPVVLRPRHALAFPLAMIIIAAPLAALTPHEMNFFLRMIYVTMAVLYFSFVPLILGMLLIAYLPPKFGRFVPFGPLGGDFQTRTLRLLWWHCRTDLTERSLRVVYLSTAALVLLFMHAAQFGIFTSYTVGSLFNNSDIYAAVSASIFMGMMPAMLVVVLVAGPDVGQEELRLFLEVRRIMNTDRRPQVHASMARSSRALGKKLAGNFTWRYTFLNPIYPPRFELLHLAVRGLEATDQPIEVARRLPDIENCLNARLSADHTVHLWRGGRVSLTYTVEAARLALDLGLLTRERRLELVRAVKSLTMARADEQPPRYRLGCRLRHREIFLGLMLLSEAGEDVDGMSDRLLDEIQNCAWPDCGLSPVEIAMCLDIAHRPHDLLRQRLRHQVRDLLWGLVWAGARGRLRPFVGAIETARRLEIPEDELPLSHDELMEKLTAVLEKPGKRAFM